ncbi:Protein FMP52 like protein [Verticillium longisporum]|nr:Protein FMP52 like protein [Verticillium longisporum]
MSAPFTSAAVIGSTGLVGSQILATLLTTTSIKTTTISRRAPPNPTGTPNLNAIVEPDTTAWAAKLTAVTPTPHTVLSGLGTTRAAAGGWANQWKIDHDLNVELLRAAKAAGVKTFVFISSAGTRGLVGSRAPYSKMKIGVEDALRDAGFDHAVVVRPGAILGTRETPQTGGRLLNAAVRSMSFFGQGVQDAFGQEHDVIARAAVRAAQIAAEGGAPDKYWVLESADIVRLGRTEWKDPAEKPAATA